MKSQRKVSLSSSVHNSTMQQHKQLLMESMKSFLTLSHQTFDLHTHSLLDTLARMKMIVAPFDGTELKYKRSILASRLHDDHPEMFCNYKKELPKHILQLFLVCTIQIVSGGEEVNMSEFA